MLPTADDFQEELETILVEAQRQNEDYVDVRSGDLHTRVGGYPASNHRMPVCCDVMKRNMRLGDEVLHEPPKGKGASVVIRYYLPR